VLADLATALGERMDIMTAGQAFGTMAAEQPAFSGLSYDRLGLRGGMVAGAAAGATA
jgi:hypothetical protein